MSEERRVIVRPSGCLVDMVEILVFALAVWLIFGGFEGHCREYPSAAICTAAYGDTGPHAQAPDAAPQDAGGAR